LNVLVVDDDKINLKLAKAYLKHAFPDYQVSLVSEPSRVMEILKEQNVDIVLLDIMMPEISGIDLLKSIREETSFRDIQVLMLTAMTDMHIFKTCFEGGANDFLRKPIEIIEFRSRISAAAKHRNHILALRENNEKMQVQTQELLKLNQKLQDAQFHLIQAEKLAAIGELAAGVAHEINTPIGYVGSNFETFSKYIFKIRTFMDYCFDELRTSQRSENQSLIHEVSLRITEKYKSLMLDYVLTDMLDIIQESQEGVSKITEIVRSLKGFAWKGSDEKKDWHTLKEIIEQVLPMIRNEAKYVVDIKRMDCELPPILCNKGQISQVILNILMNAIQEIKAQERKELGSIVIRGFQEDEYVCVGIWDDGPGVEPDHISQIFNPFFTTKDVGKGTGLGLSISHEIIVKRHHGILDVKSAPGLGAEFVIKLPLLYAGLDNEPVAGLVQGVAGD
jgi:two-component system, NtrC family, sensor kinase